MQSDSHGTIDPPAVTVIEITEPTTVNEGIELIDQDAVIAGAAPGRHPPLDD